MRTSVAITAVAPLALTTATTVFAADRKTVRFAHRVPVGSILDNTAKKFADVVNKADASVRQTRNS